ncbi:MAG TPA: CaiB/BaiF CoA-transferase family protein [Ilumatobacter sp.]|nr:CaiB/BaiF CoA-transferase family protein [Ilumatobacter sp.]
MQNDTRPDVGRVAGTGATGPLSGVRVVELAGMGPAPFAGMMLADLGATVVRVDRPPTPARPAAWSTGDIMGRGKHSVGVDLKQPDGVELVLDLCAASDVLIEGFRPGVAERLGLGPEQCMSRNAALVYGRMTGYGQDGPLAHAAGHDINYISIGGALGVIGRADQPPTPPLNLLGDFGGGGLLLVVGVLSALMHARATGEGQVVDAAMVDGTALLLAPMLPGIKMGWQGRGRGLLDSGAHFYDVYETADRRYLSVGALEEKFYVDLLARMNIDPASLPAQMDSAGWATAKAELSRVFLTKTRDEWCNLFEGSDACVTPVLEPGEAEQHPHNLERQVFVDVDGVVQAAPAPRFDRTAATVAWGPPSIGDHTDAVVSELGRSPEDIARLRSMSVIA